MDYSVHSSVERAKKITKVYVPSQWETVITLARNPKPYLVIPMTYLDFIDLKKKNSIQNLLET